MDELFNSMFGGGGGRQATRGDDIETSITITFLEAAKGTARTINVTPLVDCNTCSGTGMKPGTKRQQCRTCRGSGTEYFTIQSGFQMASTCRTCLGAGSMVPRGGECGTCSGVGKVKTRKQVQVDIPAGEFRLPFGP